MASTPDDSRETVDEALREPRKKSPRGETERPRPPEGSEPDLEHKTDWEGRTHDG
jgi:hypothetical protein